MSSTAETEQAFLAAFDAYSDALFRHALYRISDRERAIDLVQDTFMKTWKFAAEGGEVREYRAFLYRALNNLIIDEYRKKKSSSLDALLEGETVQEGHFPELVDLSHVDLESALDAEKVYELLQEVPDQYREVITMRFIDQMSPKEIAQITGESENVISVRLHRALKALKKVAEGTFVYDA